MAKLTKAQARMIRFLRSLFRLPERETYYSVNRDGKLVLDVAALLRSGRMDRQIKVAREMKRAGGGK